MLPLFSYQFSFQQFHFGIGAAIGTFAFVIVFAVALALCAHAEQGERRMSRSAFAVWRSLPFGGIPHAVLAAAFVATLPVPDLLDVCLRPEERRPRSSPIRRPCSPRSPSLAAFEYVFVRENVLRYLRNSLTIALPVTLLTVADGRRWAPMR